MDDISHMHMASQQMDGLKDLLRATGPRVRCMLFMNKVIGLSLENEPAVVECSAEDLLFMAMASGLALGLVTQTLENEDKP